MSTDQLYFFAVIDIRPSTEAAAINKSREVWLWDRYFDVAVSTVSTSADESHSSSINSFNDSRRKRVISNVVRPTSAIPKLHHRSKPKKIRRFPDVNETSVHGEALEENARYASLDEERVDISLLRLSGEEGETIASDHFENIDTLTDSEALSFLQAHLQQQTSPNKEKVLENRFLLDGSDSRHRSITTEATQSVADAEVEAPDHEANLRSLFQQLVREVGLTVTDSSNYNMDVSIKLHKLLKRSKRIVNNRHLYNLETENAIATADNESKVTLNLQISL